MFLDKLLEIRKYSDGYFVTNEFVTLLIIIFLLSIIYGRILRISEIEVSDCFVSGIIFIALIFILKQLEIFNYDLQLLTISLCLFSVYFHSYLSFIKLSPVSLIVMSCSISIVLNLINNQTLSIEQLINLLFFLLTP